MIYNDNLKSEYGIFSEISSGVSPIPFKPTPTNNDYIDGYVVRAFVKKVNEDVVVEIKPEQTSSVNRALYKPVLVNWKISGPKNSVMINGVTQNVGVIEQNRFEIDRIKKESGIDLSKQLSNLLEFWRGR